MFWLISNYSHITHKEINEQRQGYEKFYSDQRETYVSMQIYFFEYNSR